jgi:hypothetical protein
MRVERLVEIGTADDLTAAFDKRVSAGFQYGDFQFSIERDSEDFLHKGVFSCYRPVPMETPISPAQKQLSDESWRQLLYLAQIKNARSRHMPITTSPSTDRCTGQTPTG